MVLCYAITPPLENISCIRLGSLVKFLKWIVMAFKLPFFSIPPWEWYLGEIKTCQFWFSHSNPLPMGSSWAKKIFVKSLYGWDMALFSNFWQKPGYRVVLTYTSRASATAEAKKWRDAFWNSCLSPWEIQMSWLQQSLHYCHDFLVFQHN